MKNEEMARLFSGGNALYPEVPWQDHGHQVRRKRHDQRDAENAVMNDLVTLTLLGVRVVLVHGGGPAINEMLKSRRGEPLCRGLRVTDDATMEVVQQVLAGKVNKDLVAKPGDGAWAMRHGRPDAALRPAGPAAGPCG